MAYQPISQPKKSGYIPISQPKPKPKPTFQQTLDKSLPTLATVRDVSSPSFTPLFPAKRDMSKDVISQAPARERTPFGKITESLPDGKIKQGIEKFINKPAAKFGDLLRVDPQEIYRRAADELPQGTNEQVYQRALEIRRKEDPSFSGDDLSIPQQTEFDGTAGMVRRVAVKLTPRLLKEIIGASSKEAAERVARDIAPRNDAVARRIMDDIVKAKTEKDAQRIVEVAQREIEKNLPPLPRLQTTTSLRSVDGSPVTPARVPTPTQTPTPTAPARFSFADTAKQTPTPPPATSRIAPESTQVPVSRVKEVAPDLDSIRDMIIRRLEEQKPSSLPGGRPAPRSIFDTPEYRKSVKDFINEGAKKQPTLTDVNKGLELLRVSGRQVDDLAADLGNIGRDTTQVPVQSNVGRSIPPPPTQPVNQRLADFRAGRPSSQAGFVRNPLTSGTPEPLPQGRQSVSSADNTMPPLPKLPDAVRRGLEAKEVDLVINDAIRARYKNASRKPVIENAELAKIAKSDVEPSGFAKLAGRLLTPIHTRLESISPELANEMRKFEFSVGIKTHKQMQIVKPFLQKTSKMTPEDKSVFNLALLNGDTEVIDALGKRYGMTAEINQVRSALDDLITRGNKVGMDIKYRKEYFPRVIKNPKEYLAYWKGQDDWGDINRLIEAEAKKKGITYYDLMKDEEKVASIINNYIRGYGNKTVLAKPSFAKGRTIEVLDEELADFYEPAESSLVTYIIRMNDEIEGRKFFGKTVDGDINDSIGAYVMDQVAKGKIKPQREEEMAEILRSRFHRGKMYGALDLYRNAEYISTMGSPISAMTQIGDFAWSAYDNGVYSTAKALVGKKKIKREDLGIDSSIMNEFTRNTWSGRAVDRVFKIIGLDKMARLGQEAFVNAGFEKSIKLAKNNDAEFLRQLDFMFGAGEGQRVMDDFKKGILNEDTTFVVFNRLLDFQPLAKSEMPEIYLNHPNGRVFYMLKSFTLKQYDIARREFGRDLASGEPKRVAKGMKNMLYLAGLFMMANATADEIKDLVLGRETSPEDRTVDNIMRLFGASKFDLYKAREEGIATTVANKILFPRSIFDRASKDISNIATGKEYERGATAGEAYQLESTQTIPVGGKLFYWWFGRGDQKQRYKEGQEGSVANSETLPELPKLPKLPSLPTLPTI
jgi:hypothetical protein